jgi:hypothetical protein
VRDSVFGGVAAATTPHSAELLVSVCEAFAYGMDAAARAQAA